MLRLKVELSGGIQMSAGFKLQVQPSQSSPSQSSLSFQRHGRLLHTVEFWSYSHLASLVIWPAQTRSPIILVTVGNTVEARKLEHDCPPAPKARTEGKPAKSPRPTGSLLYTKLGFDSGFGIPVSCPLLVQSTYAAPESLNQEPRTLR